MNNNNFTIEITYYDGRRKGQIITWENIPEDELLDSLGELTRDQVSNAHIYILFDNKRIQFEDYLYQYFMSNKRRKSA
jgi:hypothetical protein